MICLERGSFLPWRCAMRIEPRGLLAEMAIRNRARLQADFYLADEIYLDKNNQWSGDWQGRDLLAQLSHRIIFGSDPEALHDLIERLPDHVNSGGYFGSILDLNSINEQQLAGNGWFLRALCLWHNLGDPRALPMIRKVVDELYLPLHNAVDSYPVTYGAAEEGRFDGNLREDKLGCFLLSTDVGCFYISLDGLAHAYRVDPRPELAGLIQKMITRFRQTDVVGNRFQTHATLTALRGILVFAQDTADRELMEFVEELFEQYQCHGMTLNFANYNWFGRPEWTEPCAIVDSFLLARNLFGITGKRNYLKLAYQIFYNALVFSERENGGFGCDKCAHPELPEFRIDPGAYDAYWCCTMRGAEGLRVALELTEQNGICRMDFVTAGLCYIREDAAVEIHTAFPYEDEITICDYGTKPGDQLELMLPLESEISKAEGCTAEYIENGYRITQTGENFSLTIRTERELTKAAYADGFAYDYGVLRLCAHDATSPICMNCDGLELKAVPQLWQISKDEAMNIKVKILF